MDIVDFEEKLKKEHPPIYDIFKSYKTRGAALKRVAKMYGMAVKSVSSVSSEFLEDLMTVIELGVPAGELDPGDHDVDALAFAIAEMKSPLKMAVSPEVCAKQYPTEYGSW